MNYHLKKAEPIEPETLQWLTKNIHDIPPMPENWHRIQRIIENPNASIKALSDVILNDPILTAKILQVCNSSAFAIVGNKGIHDIQLAITRLGLDETGNLIFRTLAPALGDGAGARIQIRHIWMHSQIIAMLMDLLSRSVPGMSRRDASMVGIMHDIGKMVILHIEDNKNLAAVKIAINQGVPTLEAEFKQLGYTHIDAGMMLALHWKLPTHVRQFIEFHHHPASLPVDAIPAQLQQHMMLLNLAHMIAQHFISDQTPSSSSNWANYRRSFSHHPGAFITDKLHLPLQDADLITSLKAPIEFIKLQFPDLYPTQQ
ncbi:MAG: HDOD domain-containing protein [Mariprofundus sp.]|nr:HDOD domain-containing protein [Mariprofundus sp.]